MRSTSLRAPVADHLHGAEQARVASGLLALAHADGSGHSIFEEAFTRVHRASRMA